MKLTIFIGGISGGGAERVCCNLADYLAEKGHEVSILTMADDEPTYGLNKKVRRISLLKDSERKNFLYNSFIRYKRLKHYVSKTECDSYLVMLPITILILYSLKNKIKGKIIASERNMPTLYPKWQQTAMKIISGKIDGWIFQTNQQKDWYGKALRNVTYEIIPNAINKEFLTYHLPNIYNKNNIVSVGRLNKQKNQELLINAFANIHSKFPNYKLVIYGEGPLKEHLKQIAIDKNISEFVQFPGFTKNIIDSVCGCALFVLTSNYEGIPNALIEAMALGVPCISTDCNGGGARLLIENCVNGIIVPINDVDSLSTSMEKILSNQSLANKYGEEARQICNKLSPENIYYQWEQFIIEKINK